MKSTRIFLSLAAGPMMALAACAQAPTPGAAPAAPPPPATDTAAPPPAPANAPAPPPSAVPATQTGTAANYNSRVRTVIYGPRGDAQALVLRNGVAVTLDPDLAMRLGTAVSRGTRVRVSGTEQVVAEQKSVAAQSVTANGQTYVAQMPPAGPGALPGVGPAGAMAAAAPPPPPPPGPGPRPRRRGPNAGPGAGPDAGPGSGPGAGPGAGLSAVPPPPPPAAGAEGPLPPPPPDGATPPPPPPQN